LNGAERKETGLKLQGKVAIVAGGGQGIGEGIVKCLAEEGADVAVFDINPNTANSMAAQDKKLGRKALPVVADLTVKAQVDGAVKKTVDFFGKIDILVNDVGGVSVETGEMMRQYKSTFADQTLPGFMYDSPEVWDRYFALNLKSHVMLCQAVTPYFIKQRSGKIVNISSTSGRIADPSQMHYASMKAGDISITWTLARALARFNITVNCICPGFVYTPLWDRGAIARLEEMREAKKKGTLPLPFSRITDEELASLTPREFWLRYIVIPNTPNGRDQTPEDMGKAVAFFVSEDARNITGQVLHVDGGFVMR